MYCRAYGAAERHAVAVRIVIGLVRSPRITACLLHSKAGRGITDTQNQYLTIDPWSNRCVVETQSVSSSYPSVDSQTSKSSTHLYTIIDKPLDTQLDVQNQTPCERYRASTAIDNVDHWNDVLVSTDRTHFSKRSFYTCYHPPATQSTWTLLKVAEREKLVFPTLR